MQLFAVVLLLFLIVLQELMARFFDEPLFFLDAEKINILANGLMATVLLLTVLSGVHYIFRASFSVKGSDVHR